MNLIKRKPVKGMVLTLEQFDLLHEQLAKVRSTSKTVTLDKDAARALLQDYSKAIEMLERVLPL